MFKHCFEGGRERYFATGRKKAGEMNKTEEAYGERLEAMRRAGFVHSWKYESVTFKLAKDCRYTPDFYVLNADGVPEFHEVKGSPFVFQDDAKVKIKVAAEQHPEFRFFVCWPRKKQDGGGWEIKEM